MITRRRYERLNDQAYALYLKIDRLWFDLFLITRADDPDAMRHFDRVDPLLKRASDRCKRRARLRVLSVPPAPVPIYSLELGQVFATFLDGTSWLQTGPERWSYLGQYPQAVR